MTVGPTTLASDARRSLGAEERRSLVVDVALSIAALVGLALAGAAIQRELGRRAPDTLAPTAPIAHLERTQGNVKRRNASGLVWDVVGVGDVVGRGDGLFVPAEAVADVVFDDGSVLTVAPSSLVIIDAFEPATSAPTVTLRQGGVVAAPGERGLAVRSGLSRTAVGAQGLAAVALQADGSARVDVTRGHATITTPGGDSLQVREQGAATASSQGVRRIDSRAVLVSPAGGARRFFGGARGAVTFVWRTSVPQVTFQLADDRAFTRLLLERPVTGGQVEVGDLAPGSYFWRVRASDGAWASEGRPLLVVRDLPPETISPGRGQLVYSPPGTPTGFRWSEVTGVGRYRLQIAADSAFEKRLVDREVTGTQVRLASFAPEGIYRWRVRALDRERGDSPFSSSATFRLILEPLPAAPQLYDPQLELEGPPPPTVVPAREGPVPGRPQAPPPIAPGHDAPSRGSGEPPAAAPRLERPTHGYAPGGAPASALERLLWRLVGGVALAAEAPPEPGGAQGAPAPDATAAPLAVAVLLRWSPVPGVVSYVLEIAEDEKFDPVLVRERLGQPYYRWRPPSTGKYWWRVQSIDAKGREGLFSEAKPISRAPEVPELVSPADGARVGLGGRPASVEVTWRPQHVAFAYSVELARDAAFHTVVARTTTPGAKATFVVQQPGPYWWRVRGLDASGAEGPVSAGRKVRVELDPPTLVAAARRSFGDGKPVALEASAVLGAERYELELGLDPALESPFAREIRPTPRFEWIPPAPGAWIWRVRAIAGRESSAWSAPSELVVAPPPPAVVTPADGAVLTYRGDAVPLRVRLKPVAGATAYRVRVTPGDPNGRLRTIGTELPHGSDVLPVDLEGLGAGRYVLSAVAMTGTIESDPSRPVRIERVRAAPLGAPTPSRPAPGAQLAAGPDPAGVEFAWSAVPGAVAYRLVVQGDGNESVAEVSSPQVSYRAALGPGQYRWHVRAVDGDGVDGSPSQPLELQYAVAETTASSLASSVAATPHAVGRARRSLFGDKLQLGVSAGVVVTNGGRAMASGELEVAVALGALYRGLSAVVRAGYHRQDVSTAGPPAASATQNAVPVAAGARLAFAGTRIVPYVGAAALVGVLHADVRTEGQPALGTTRVGFGVEGGAGIETPLGPGALFVEARYGWLRGSDRGVALDGGGVTTAVGYRVRP